MAPCTHPGTSREVHEVRLPRTCSRPCAFEAKKTKKKTKSHQALKKHTTKYIHSSPATATTSRRGAGNHFPLGSPYSYSSSIDLGFVEIGLTYLYTHVCIYSHCCCCCCAACVRFGALYYFPASAASSFSAVILVCMYRRFRGCPVVLDIYLSFP